MGISGMPSPSEGLLSIILIYTLFSIITLKSIFHSILAILRIHPPPSSPSFQHYLHLRLPIPAGIRFGSIEDDDDRDCHCSVCLAQFEVESEVSWLPCGHFFHRACFQRWLDCSKLTCPLCRTPLLLQEQQQQQQQ